MVTIVMPPSVLAAVVTKFKSLDWVGGREGAGAEDSIRNNLKQFIHTDCDGEDREEGEEWIGRKEAKGWRRKKIENNKCLLLEKRADPVASHKTH